MTEGEREEINELSKFLMAYAAKFNLTTTELFGRLYMAQQALWFNLYGNGELFDEPDENDPLPPWTSENN